MTEPKDEHVVIEAPALVVAPPAKPQTAKEQDGAEKTKRAEESETALHSQGQRDVSLMWETTQMRLALSVIWTSLALAVALGAFGKWLSSEDTQLASLVFLYGVANLVTGFYFGRTNHQRVGGPGGDQAGTR